MARIELRNLGHSYNSDGIYALNPMDHTWEDGGAYALLGPSGCGKTTLLNIISGLVKPSEGRVLFDGRDVTDLPPQERNIAQVFQFPVIYDTMTVYDNLAFPLRNRKVRPDMIRKRVNAVADMLELGPMLRRRASNLGADDKQKISMGRGLVRDDVAAILFDEPLTVIDPHLKWVLRRKLREIHAEFGHTFIYVTHDQTEALTLAHTVVVMTEGKVVQIGTPQELFENPKHTFVGYFIGSPGMNFLPCSVDDGKARVGAQAIPLPPDVARAADDLDGSLELGIRPERLQVTAARADGSVPARLQRVEDLGSHNLVRTLLGEHSLLATVSEFHDLRPDEDVGLLFPGEWVRLYCNGELVE